MGAPANLASIRTTTDAVFETLQAEILSLELPPGSKISEAEVARRMGVSRQPVRDAFNRLGHLDLLLIRPQRATVVRGFSMEQISNARFIRLAVELEVVDRACLHWNDERSEALGTILAKQERAMKKGETTTFHSFDYDFHKLICDLSGFPRAFETIEQCKRKVDRLCVLSLSDASEVGAIFKDHKDIAEALDRGKIEDVRAVTRRHLGRLDDTIESIREAHSAFFE